MGTLLGHLSPGTGLLVMGLWHLYNTVTLYARAPARFRTRLWFEPRNATGIFRYAELLTIIIGCSASLIGELFVSSVNHLPFARDFSIPVDNLNNFEHGMIFFFFIVYASILLFVETSGAAARVPPGLLQLVATALLGVEALMFHFHSANHGGTEGHYHMFFEAIVEVGMVCTLLEIPFPRAFLVTLVRSVSLVLQGIWLIHMGLILFVPAFVPKGCVKNSPDNEEEVLSCEGHRAVMRAQAIANLQFSLYLALVIVATIAFFLRATAKGGSVAEYQGLTQAEEEAGDSKAVFRLSDEITGVDFEEESRGMKPLCVERRM